MWPFKRKNLLFFWTDSDLSSGIDFTLVWHFKRGSSVCAVFISYVMLLDLMTIFFGMALYLSVCLSVCLTKTVMLYFQLPDVGGFCGRFHGSGYADQTGSGNARERRHRQREHRHRWEPHSDTQPSSQPLSDIEIK